MPVALVAIGSTVCLHRHGALVKCCGCSVSYLQHRPPVCMHTLDMSAIATHSKWSTLQDRVACRTVVDAVHFSKCLHAAAGDDAAREVVNQVAFADLVLLNKIDLVDAGKLQDVEASIRSINAVARVIHTRLDTDHSPQWLTKVSFLTANVLLQTCRHWQASHRTACRHAWR